MNIGTVLYNKANKNQLYRSIYFFYNIQNTLQYYFPYFSYITNYNYGKIRLNHKYELIRLLYKKQRCTHHGRIFVGLICTNHKLYSKKYIFVKELSIIPYMWFELIRMNDDKTNKNMSSPLQFQYSQYINSIYNSTYIDIFCTYLCSKLVENHISPHFPIFYGTNQCIFNKYSFEVEQNEIHLFRNKYNHSKIFKNKSGYSVEYKHVPVQLLFMEKIAHTFDDFLESEQLQKKNLFYFKLLLQYALFKKYSIATTIYMLISCIRIQIRNIYTII